MEEIERWCWIWSSLEGAGGKVLCLATLMDGFGGAVRCAASWLNDVALERS